MKQIRVRHNNHVHIVLVDDADYEWLTTYVWRWRNGYAVTRTMGRYTGMHRMIMKANFGEKIIIDHIDGNHRNNQRNNLRRATRYQNQQNRKTNKDNKLPKGIRLLPSGKYGVRLQTNGQRVVVGTFPTLAEAIEERNRVAQHLHGEFFRASHPV